MSRDTASNLRIALYSRAPFGDACSYLRVLGPAKHCQFEVFNGAAHGVCKSFLESVDLIVVQRDFPKEIDQYEALVEFTRAADIPLVYEIDDLLTQIPTGYRESESHHYATAMLPILEAISHADMVTTTTHPLLAYCRQFNSNVCLLPNYLDDSIWHVRPVSDRPRNRPVIVGYMGGASHADDLHRLVPVIKRLSSRYGSRVLFRFWGCRPPEEIQFHRQVEWLPMNLHSYAEFAEKFSPFECDIFVAPLIRNANTECKSAIKFLECGSKGAPGIYEDFLPYSSVVTHGKNGYLANDEDDWTEYIGRLVDDSNLRQQMGKQAQETVLRDWLLSANCSRWKDAYERLTGSSARVRSETKDEEEAFNKEVLRIGRDLTVCVPQKERELANLRKRHVVVSQIGTITTKLLMIFSVRRWSAYLRKNYRKVRYGI